MRRECSVARRSEGARCHGQRAFTLIELLVVMVIMGISLGLVAVQLMPDERTLLRDEAARLALLLENAGLEARSSGRSMAWSGESTRYLFWRKNNHNDWVRIDDGSEFRPRSLPEGMRINAIFVENLPLKYGEPLRFSAAAFALPYRIHLSNANASVSVVGKSSGEVVLVSGGSEGSDGGVQ